MKTMKNLLLALVFFTATLSLQAQVSINVNVGSPPAWGPSGYTDVQYYYLPDIDVYYDINTGQYIYLNNNNWVRATALPPAYRNYDLYNGYKVVMTDYRGNAPYTNHATYRAKYPKGYRGAPQKTIGARPNRGNNGGVKHTNAPRKTNNGNAPRANNGGVKHNAPPVKNNNGGNAQAHNNGPAKGNEGKHDNGKGKKN